VKPVVTHPSVHHGIHGYRNFKRRMRIYQRHQRGKTIVRNSENAHPPVTLGDVLHQPVDGVVGVGGVVDGSWILRAAQGPVHHVVTLRVILAANVFDHADIAALDDYIHCVVVALQDRPEVRTRRMAG